MANTTNSVSPNAPIQPQQPVQPQAPVPPPPNQPKKKKGKGCLIAIAIFFGLGIISVIFSNTDKKSTSNNDTITADSTEVKEPVSLIDSAKIKELKPYFNEKKDEFKGVTWIEPKSRPKYTNMNGICTYFCVDKNGKPSNLRFLIQYYANDWLFINSYIFLIDGKTYTFSNPDMERDNDSKIWEWSDTAVSDNDEVYLILSAIKYAKEVKIRFNGRQYNKDKTLTQKDIKAITQPIEYFEALGGQF
jgi:hypothetical protein